MGKGNEYQILVNGLALGNHSYHFDVKDDFFEGEAYEWIYQKITDDLVEKDKEII